MADGSPLSVIAATDIYEILVRVLDAPRDEDGHDVYQFVHHETKGCVEYRFMGCLGFGGKFWNANDRWYVNCYPEDRTEELDALMKIANDALAFLRAEHYPA